MANINRDYLIINDVKKSSITLDNGSMFFYITDKNTQNIFINLVINVSNNDLIQKYANIENAEDYTLTMNIVKPDNTYKIIEGKLHDKESAIFEFSLNEDCCDEIGTYRCELLTKCNINDHEEITTSNKLTYKVKSSVLNDLDGIVEAPEYPLVIQLFDKLSDIEQYEEDRRANELARQLAEEQRQARFNTLDADMTNSIQVMDNKVVDVENRITTKEQAVDKLINDTKADIDEYKVAKDQEIDEYKATKDTEINNAITNQDNKIDMAIANQDNKIDEAISNQNNRLDTLENRATQHESRLTGVEAKNAEQDGRLDVIENKNQQQDSRLDVVESKNTQQDNRLDVIEAIDVAQNARLDAIEVKNQEQDDRLLDIEKVNKRQDMNLKCLFAESKNNMIDITEEGNSIYLQNSTIGYTLIDEIKGNTLVNCNKEPDKELILNGNINTSGDNAVTITEGVDGGLVDVALEGNTLVNVSKTKDSTAITKAYTVENSGNHIALQGDIDGSCRPVITGNTLWIDNDTEEVLTVFDGSKNLRLQSSFEDNLVTQEMVDSGEEVADNLGKYRVDYKSTREDGTVGNTKTLYLNSPLLEGDTIEEKDGGIYHVHRSELLAYIEGDETSLITDKVNTLHQLETPQYELIEQSNLAIPSYTNGHLDLASAVPVSKVNFLHFEEELTYLYPATSYTLQFVSDKAITVDITLGGTSLLSQSIVKGLNRISITTPATLVDNKLTIDGLGANISEVVVTDTNREFRYFEGMKSVGQDDANGHKIEIKSKNGNYIELDNMVQGSFDVDGITHWEADTEIKTEYFIEIPEGCTQIYFDKLFGMNNRIWEYDENKNVLGRKVTESVDTPITLSSNTKYIRCRFLTGDTSTKIILFFDEKIELKQNKKEISLSEPLRSLPNGTKDRIVKIGGKWYIERNCREMVLDGSDDEIWSKESTYSNGITSFYLQNNSMKKLPTYINAMLCNRLKVVAGYYISLSDNCISGYSNVNKYPNENWIYIFIKVDTLDNLKQYLQQNPITVVYQLAQPTYEPIDYNPLEVYSDVTHITTNSTIPTNITVKNHGFNCLLKPSTTYTVSSNLGLNTVTTPSTLAEDCLRFYDTDTSDITTMKDVLILEGDWTTKADLIPANFNGIESAFEQEYDAEKGKYKVNAKVANEDKSKENNITFYINESLRGIRDVKDRVYVKDDKVVVQRNCGIRPYEDGDFGTYPTDKVNTVYPLAEPTYEGVEYNDVKLFIETFKNSTLSYNSNVPVTSTLHYSYSVPIVDTVAQTANVTDQQDSMIIDLATQCAVMEMMLM